MDGQRVSRRPDSKQEALKPGMPPGRARRQPARPIVLASIARPRRERGGQEWHDVPAGRDRRDRLGSRLDRRTGPEQGCVRVVTDPPVDRLDDIPHPGPAERACQILGCLGLPERGSGHRGHQAQDEHHRTSQSIHLRPHYRGSTRSGQAARPRRQRQINGKTIAGRGREPIPTAFRLPTPSRAPQARRARAKAATMPPAMEARRSDEGSGVAAGVPLNPTSAKRQLPELLL